MLQSQTILTGRRVLILEDEVLVAMGFETMLMGLGCASVAVANNVGTALRLIETYRPEFALIDFHLGQETSVDVLATLAVRGIPFALATSAAPETLEPFADVAIVRKPCDAAGIERALLAALARSCGSAERPVAHAVSCDAEQRGVLRARVRGAACEERHPTLAGAREEARAIRRPLQISAPARGPRGPCWRL